MIGVLGILRVIAMSLFIMITVGPMGFVWVRKLLKKLMGKRGHVRLLHFTTYVLRYLWGAKVNLIGKIPEDGLLLANHTGWGDGIFIRYYFLISIVIKSELTDTPLKKFIFADSMASVATDRSNKRSMVESLGKMREDLEELSPLWFMFPEGKTSDGLQVLPFKSSLISMVFDENSKPVKDVYPVVLFYTKSNGKYMDKNMIKYYSRQGADNVFEHLKRIMCRRSVEVNLTVLPKVPQEFLSNRKTVAAYAHKQVSEFYNEQLEKNEVLAKEAL